MRHILKSTSSYSILIFDRTNPVTAVEKFRAKKGLEGVVFDTTSISNVVPERKSLYYRGYPVHQLAEKCKFEEVAHLLLYGELPNANELTKFCTEERSERVLPAGVLATLKEMPREGHPMDAIRTCVSLLGMLPEFQTGNHPTAVLQQGTALLAKTPTIVAAFHRLRHGEQTIAPETTLSFSENFFHMCLGKVPKDEIVNAFDGALTLYAEHGFNASTFSARTIASTLSDLCGAVCGATAALKGSLHGGANEAVMHLLKEIETPDNTRRWLDNAIATKKKVMGFGHRVYRRGDSRVPQMTKYRDLLAKQCGGQKWVEISNIIESEMLSRKGIYPNLDFPAGPAYYMMGFEIDLFTPIFVMARIVGWTAHVAEQLSDNRIVRPLAEYVGAQPRDVPGIEQR